MNCHSKNQELLSLEQFRTCSNSTPRNWTQSLTSCAALMALVGLSLVYLGKLRGSFGFGALVFAILVGATLYKSAQTSSSRLRS